MLFLNVIYKSVYTEYSLSEESIEKYFELVEKNPSVINPSEMSKINKTLSRISFSFKEIYQYLKIRNSDDDHLIFYLRKPFKDYKNLKSEEGLLKNIKLSVYS